MSTYKVVLTQDAELDLEAIYDYITLHDSASNADYVLDQLLATADSLAHFPEKGSVPQELQSLGIRKIHQVFFKPYRIIYQVIGKQVVIFVMADGRRDMQALLMRRLLEQ